MNTIQELFETRSGDRAHIHCAKCGNPMTVRTPGGIHPVLSDHTRRSLDHHLSNYRYSWLRTIVAAIYEINYGVMPRAALQDSTIDVNRVFDSSGDISDKWWALADGRVKKSNRDNVEKIINELSPGDIGEQIQEKVKSLWELKVDCDADTPNLDSLNGQDVSEAIGHVLLPIESSFLFNASLGVIINEPRIRRWIQSTKSDISVRSKIQQKSDLVGPRDDGENAAPSKNPLDSPKTAIEVPLKDTIQALQELIPEQARVVLQYLKIIGVALDEDEYFQEKLYEYLSKMELSKNVTNEATSQVQPFEPSELRKRLRRRCERAAFLVTLMYMHLTDQGRNIIEEQFSTQGRKPSGTGAYELPYTTPISFTDMRKLLTSIEVSQYDVLRLGTSFSNAIEKINNAVSKSTNPDNNRDNPNHEWFITMLKDSDVRALFTKAFGFACQGSPSNFLEFENDESSETADPDFNGTTINQNEIDQSTENRNTVGAVRDYPGNDELYKVVDICGWYPKEKQTRSVVLVGSPGSAKSSTFLSGAATILKSITGASAFICNATPSTETQIDRLKRAFRENKKPAPTNVALYHSLEFTLRSNSSISSATDNVNEDYFIFTDIPGEVATQPLREGKVPPILEQSLQAADVVVIFLDLSIDPDFATRFATSMNIAKLQDLVAERRRVRERRKDEVGNRAGGAESYADVDQLQFLDSIVRECMTRPNHTKPHLMVVVPKADLFANMNKDMNNINNNEANASEDQVHILQDAFDHASSGDSALLYPRPEPGNDNYNHLRWLTSAGMSVEARGTKNQAEAIITVIKELSQKTVNGLTNIGNLVQPPSDSNETQEAKKWNALIKSKINGLHTSFGPDYVYFLPVSAQGAPSNLTETVSSTQLAESANEEEDGNHFDPQQAPNDIEPDAVFNDALTLNNPSGELSETLARPQKFCEFLFILPMMLVVKDQWSQTPRGDQNPSANQPPNEPTASGQQISPTVQARTGR